MILSGSLGKVQRCHLPCYTRVKQSQHRPRGRTISRVGRDETPEQALERRMKESAKVEEKIRYIYSRDDFHRELAVGGKNLIVLEIQGESVCQSGSLEEDQKEYHWKIDQETAAKEAMKRCTDIKHTFQRIARDCSDATFLSVMVAENSPTDESSALCDELGVDVFPTLQFWKDGNKLWEHRGALHMSDDLAEGVLYYEGSAANGVRITDYVEELKDRASFDRFILGNGPDDHILKVVNVALTSASPCIHVYPAVLALARNFVGYASFARVMGDTGPEQAKLLKDYNVVEVPTFIFFRDGKEMGRHVGSSRADLIGQILQIQQSLGVMPPQKAPVRGVQQRQRASWR